MASLVLLLSEIVHLHNPNFVDYVLDLPPPLAVSTLPKPTIHHQQQVEEVEEEEDLQHLRVCIEDDQVWP